MILNSLYNTLGLEQIIRAGDFGDIIVHKPVEKFMVAEPPI
jgi:hypothetical protein